MLEIDVDIRRLVALGRDEALEQQVDLAGIDGGDAEAVADRGIGRRAAALAQDSLPAAGVTHDIVHRQEIGRVAELPDQRQLVHHGRPDPVRHSGGRSGWPRRAMSAARALVEGSFLQESDRPGRHILVGRAKTVIFFNNFRLLSDGIRVRMEKIRHLLGGFEMAPRHCRTGGSRPRPGCSARGCRSARPGAAGARRGCGSRDVVGRHLSGTPAAIARPAQPVQPPGHRRRDTGSSPRARHCPEKDRLSA